MKSIACIAATILFLAALCHTAGVDVTFVKMIGGGHGDFYTPEAIGRVRNFYDKHLRGKDTEVSGEPVTREGK